MDSLLPLSFFARVVSVWGMVGSRVARGGGREAKVGLFCCLYFFYSGSLVKKAGRRCDSKDDYPKSAMKAITIPGVKLSVL
jgi:hypothetical protein